jgi:hypothetical protein
MEAMDGIAAVDNWKSTSRLVIMCNQSRGCSHDTGKLLLCFCWYVP